MSVMNKLVINFSNRIFSNIFLVGICFVLSYCNTNGTPEIHADVDDCVNCNMIISQLNQGCGYFHGGEFLTFCSSQCLLTTYQKLNQKNRPESAMIYFPDYPGSQLIPADSIIFLLTNNITTVMNSGALSFGDADIAASYKKHPDELVTDWRGYMIVKGKPDRTIEVSISNERINPDIIQMQKGEIVVWNIRPVNENIQGRFQLKGFEEMTNIEIKSGGMPVSLRMLADKPGDGFPFIRISDGRPMGMVKVKGAHTSDEEAM